MWKPIESAPKDGTYILIARKAMPPVVAKWFQNGSKEKKSWRAGWPSEWRGVDTGATILGKPTHWMELPEQPVADAA